MWKTKKKKKFPPLNFANNWCRCIMWHNESTVTENGKQSLQVVERTSMTLITQVSAGFQGQRWRQLKWKNGVQKNDTCHFTEATFERELIPNNEKMTMAANTWAWIPPDKSFEVMSSQDKCARVLKDQGEKQWELWIINKLQLTF